MSTYHLAQLNIAKMKYSIETPEMADFVNNLDRINALADEAPGFVWRLQLDGVLTTDNDPFSSDYIINMSVWESVEALHDYTYRTAHAKIMSRRKEWFHRMEEAFMVLWWVPAETIPTLEDAHVKLTHLQNHGPTAEAFTFKNKFPAPMPL